MKGCKEEEDTVGTMSQKVIDSRFLVEVEEGSKAGIKTREKVVQVVEVQES